MAYTSSLPASVQHKNLLFDFYGGLLTEKQCSFFTMHYMEDLSLAEIGEHCGVTPQAVADLLKRANKLLENYEARLGLVSKLAQQKETMRLIQQQTNIIRCGAHDGLPDVTDAAEQIRILASEMML